MGLYKTINGGDVEDTDVNQLVDSLTGQADVGNIALYAPIAVPGAPTAAVYATAGNLTGAYKYAVCFLTGYWQGLVGSGTLHLQGNTGIGAASATISPSGQQASLSNIPIGPTGAVARVLCRTKANGSTFYVLAQISDNVTTTWTDNIADNGLTVLAAVANTTGTYLQLPNLTALPAVGAVNVLCVVNRQLYQSNGVAWVALPPASHAATHMGGSDPIPVATETIDGLYPHADKAKLDGVAVGATSVPFAIDTGTANAYVANPTYGWSSYANGMRIVVKILNTNSSTTCTLNVSGLGAQYIYKANGQLLNVGDLITGSYYEFVFWAQGWQLIGGDLDAYKLNGQLGSYYAPLASPALTGTPTAPTPTATDRSTKIATTAFVQEQLGLIPYAVDTGAANAYVVMLSPAPTAYTDGMALAVKIANTSTGASIINVNMLGAQTILDSLGNAITAGGLKAGIIYSLRYNATTGNFIVQGKGGGGNALAANLLLNKTATVDSGPIIGSMPNNPDPSATITTQNGQVTIPAGYSPGGIIRALLTNFAAAVIKAGVTVGGVLGTFTADATATAAQILANATAYVNGAKITGIMPERGSPTFNPGDSIPAGHYGGGSVAYEGHGSQTFSTPGNFTFTVPAGVSQIIAELWGAGGGGNGNYQNNYNAGAAGGGGAYVEVLVSVTPGQQISVVVGAAGAGSAGTTASSPIAGIDGETTSFGNAQAPGGKGASAAPYTMSGGKGGGGGGGAGGANTGTDNMGQGYPGVAYTPSFSGAVLMRAIGGGGGGGNCGGNDATLFDCGGAGGSGGQGGLWPGNNSAGGGGSGGGGGGGGGAGGGNQSYPLNGNAGSFPAGGGGGASGHGPGSSATGGNGGNGQVQIWW